MRTTIYLRKSSQFHLTVKRKVRNNTHTMPVSKNYFNFTLHLPSNKKAWCIISLGVIVVCLTVWLILYLRSQASIASPITATSLKSNYQEQLTTVQARNTDKALLANKFIILDVRSTEEYQKSHIQGALSAPVQALNQNIYDPNLQIVIYSPHPDEIAAATNALKAKNIKSILQLTDSLDNLKKAGYTITDD